MLLNSFRTYYMVKNVSYNDLFEYFLSVTFYTYQFEIYVCGHYYEEMY